jgi:hypothetical protein
MGKVIVSLSGGLGNQMFQYAAGLAVADSDQSRLLLDIGFYESQRTQGLTVRRFVLPCIGIKERVVGRNASRLLRVTSWAKSIVRQVFLAPSSYLNFTEDTQFIHDKRIAPTNKSVFINGFWQAKTYAEMVASSVWSNIDNNLALISEKHPLISKVPPSSESIAIHVRRGDYKGELLVCSQKYFERAIDLLRQQSATAVKNVVVFSDDIEWVRYNLSVSNCNVFYCDRNLAGSDVADFAFMSRFSKVVISNSSYSWWAAFFAMVRDPDESIVVAPSLWWNGIKADAIDIYPNRWIKLSVD